jgi:hypothetical protein
MNLEELEARLQSLVEIDLMKAFPGKEVEDVIFQKLAAAINQNTVALENGSVAAPNVYTLIVPESSATLWREKSLLEILLHSIDTAAREAGLHFVTTPTITVTIDERLAENDADIVASHRVEPMAETKATPLDTGSLEDSGAIPENAFLIVEGVRVFPLAEGVVNIGRRLDNQLVIDDPRVSRNHAQLRSIKGRFVVFDLNSTGGTFVNGQRTSQSVLYPGDVISLAGVALIFGQDNPPPRPDLKDTAPLQNASADRPTAVLKERSTAKLKKK